MIRPIRFALLSLTLAAGAVAACHHSDDPRQTGCYDLSAPGVIAYMPPIDVRIRDASGRGLAYRAHVVVTRSNAIDSVVAIGFDTVDVRTGFDAAGTYTVTVSKPYYQTKTISGVVVRAGGCTFLTTTVPVTLALAPGAPAVRSLGVLGQPFLSAPGDHATLVPWLDADAGVSPTILWRSADTTLATVDASGVVTGKCSTIGGADSVTAISAADTTVRGKAAVVVMKQASCT